MISRAVLMKSGLVSFNIVRQVNTTHPKITMNSARPMTNLSKTAHSTVKRPIHKNTTFKNSNFNQRVNIVKDKNVNTVRPKAIVNAARPKAVDNAVKGNNVNAVKGNNVNAVKASACWVWKLKTKVLDHDQGVIDSGCSRHMTGNMSYLTDYEEIDGGICLPFGVTPKEENHRQSRFSWVFFLATKDEISGILKSFITRVENLIDQRVKVIRCDNGTEFKNKEMNQFCERKGIKREFSVARTPQQNGVAERKNRTLIEAARTMLADSKLPTTFWAEAVNTACYVQNRVLVTKPHNKTPYELFLGRKPALGFMRPFGCHVTILNTIDHLGKFDGKADEGFFVGYSINSKQLENEPNWLFDIDAPTKSINYKPIVAGNQSNGNACTKACDDAGKARMETVPSKDYILLPLWHADPSSSQSSKSSPDAGFKPSGDNEKKVTKELGKEGGDSINVVGAKTSIELPDDSNMPELEDIVYSGDDEDVGVEADMSNLDAFMPVIQPIGTKWVFKNKKDERGIVIKNKARLVAQGYTQEKGINYDEVFASVARIEAIMLFLAYASFKDFVVYQMDVKSAFLYGKIEEEVCVSQPPGYEDPYFPDIVYKVEKALYGLHQAPRAWYETLSTPFSVQWGFSEGRIDRHKSLCTEFEKMMHKKFQMSSMGELTFFLGLEVKQKEDGIFISQDKYMTEILKKFGFIDVKTASTPMETQKLLLKDEDGEEVDVHLYRSMISSLMYLTSLRPDIMFAVCACARYQVNPKVSHLHAVKMIFRYLKGQPKLGLWYLKDSPFDLVAFTDSDYTRASLDRKSTTRDRCTNLYQSKGCCLEGDEEVRGIIHIKAEYSVRDTSRMSNEMPDSIYFDMSSSAMIMKLFQDMQLIQKLRDDQKCMKKVFEDMSGRNIVTNSRVTPSWREIVSLTFSEAGVLHVNWISFGHCVWRLTRDIYAAVDSCETAQEIWLRVQQMMKGSDIGIQEKKAKLFNEWERNQVVQNAVQNPGVQNVRNLNGLIVVSGIANPNANQIRNGNVVAARVEGIQLQAKEFDFMAAAGDLDEIEEVNANCILMANLQQASTSDTQIDKAPVYDSDGSAENDNNVISAVSSVEQGGGTVE
ncbi:retrovirus-related pol polyprotein from transposon TNT 1-94 [Tanacetum coccineum]